MRWVKVLVIAVAVVIAISAISAIVHLIQLAIVAIVIGGVVVAAVKAAEMLRGSRGSREVGGGNRQAEESREPMTPPQLDVRRPATQATTAVPQHDVEAELARLKREMGDQTR